MRNLMQYVSDSLKKEAAPANSMQYTPGYVRQVVDKAVREYEYKLERRNAKKGI